MSFAKESISCFVVSNTPLLPKLTDTTLISVLSGEMLSM